MNGGITPPWAHDAAQFIWYFLSDAKFWVGLALPTVLFLVLARRRNISVSLGLPFGLGSATFDLTPRDRVLAWKLYVQLVTRKAALPFDKENDVIADVFDSLYDLFQVARDLLSDLPPNYFNRESGVAALVIRVLNDGVRPLLTRWQSEYRRWWESALAAEENRAKSPQHIQRTYPRYSEIIEGLGVTNTELSKFADELVYIAAGRQARTQDSAKPKPLPPSVTPEKLELPSDSG